MSKLIAVWGAPNSGKTTFSIKLANAVYTKYLATVLVVFADIETPTLPVICPFVKTKLHSLGEILSKLEINREDVLSGILTKKERENYGLAGFISGDNRNRFPEYNAFKVDELLEQMKLLADVIIVDCSSALHDVFSNTVIQRADKAFRIYSPTMKSLSFMNSQLPLYVDKAYKLNEQVVILNQPARDVDYPVEEVKSQIGRVGYVIPYSREIQEQAINGELTEAGRDKKIRDVFVEIATKEVAGL